MGHIDVIIDSLSGRLPDRPCATVSIDEVRPGDEIDFPGSRRSEGPIEPGVFLEETMIGWKNWTSAMGSPVVPPTRLRLQKMLSCSTLDEEYVFGKTWAPSVPTSGFVTWRSGL
jgi:hypothetical protein